MDSIIAAVPAFEPIAAYGRLPSWLAARLGAQPNLARQFDVRLGWVRPPQLAQCSASQACPPNDWLECSIEVGPRADGRTQLTVRKRAYYLDYEAMHGLQVPYVTPSTRIAVNGPLPLWLFAALGQAYRDCREVWADQPQRQHV